MKAWKGLLVRCWPFVHLLFSWHFSEMEGGHEKRKKRKGMRCRWRRDEVFFCFRRAPVREWLSSIQTLRLHRGVDGLWLQTLTRRRSPCWNTFYAFALTSCVWKVKNIYLWIHTKGISLFNVQAVTRSELAAHPLCLWENNATGFRLHQPQYELGKLGNL